MKSRHYWISFALIGFFVTLSFALYRVEAGAPGARIDGFGDAFWFMIVTMTTVGYGDVYPVTVGGRLIGALFVVASLGVLGFLIGQVTEFIAQYKERRRLGINGTDFTDHVVVIGWNDLSKIIVDKLLESQHPVAVLTERKENFEAADDHFTDENVFLTFSDTLDESSFERVGLARARAVLVNRSGDAENLITILEIKDYDPDARTLVCAYNEELIPTFNRAGATYVLSRQDILARIVSHYITSPEDQVFTDDFLTSAREDGVMGVTDHQ